MVLMRIRSKNHCKRMINQCRMWRAEGRGQIRFHQGTSNVDGYEGEDGDEADADVEEDASQADDGSTQNVEDSGHSTRECEDWTVYLKPLIFNNGKANAMASDVSEAKTVL